MAACVTSSSCHILNMVKIVSLQEITLSEALGHSSCLTTSLSKNLRRLVCSIDFSHIEVYKDEKPHVEYIFATLVTKIAKHIMYK